MGGASSKLDENDWEKADGQLTSSEDTLDGAPPTDHYQVFYLNKKSVNQREFDVTDEEQNLVYTTRAVPGTIACFDVLGRSIDAGCVLRVTVDLVRRYWIVYRFGVPAFPGQFADRQATNKLVAEYFAEGGRPTATGDGSVSSATPLLFRRSCITVSWSRYMAVAALYGPPTIEMVMAEAIKKKDEEDPDVLESSEDDLFQEASLIASRMKERRCFGDDKVGPEMKHKAEGKEDTVKTEELVSNIEESCEDLDRNGDSSKHQGRNFARGRSNITIVEQHLRKSISMPILAPDPWAKPIEESSSCLEENSPLLRRQSSSSLEESTRQSMKKSVKKSTSAVRGWLRQKSKSVVESSERYLSRPGPDLGEGILHFDKPLLLCQEIYNKIFGNHQTSLVSKERALELLQQDMAKYVKEHLEGEAVVKDKDNPLMTTEETRGLLENFKSSSSNNNESNAYITSNGYDQRGSMDKKLRGNAQEEPKVAENRIEENQQDERMRKQQPLIGYWNWENTLRTHKMKMHVAKGSDLALHIVLAIIVNQVRYERNAVAMSV